MDDLLLFTPSKELHRNKLEDLLKALLKNRLKISPKQCQLFKTGLQFHLNMYNSSIEQQESLCENTKEQARSNSEATTTKDTQGMQKFCRCGKFSQYVLPRIAKATKAHV